MRSDRIHQSYFACQAGALKLSAGSDTDKGVVQEMITFQYGYFAKGFPCLEAIVHSYHCAVGHVIFMPVFLERMIYAVAHDSEARFQIKIHMCGGMQFQLKS